MRTLVTEGTTIERSSTAVQNEGGRIEIGERTVIRLHVSCLHSSRAHSYSTPAQRPYSTIAFAFYARARRELRFARIKIDSPVYVRVESIRQRVLRKDPIIMVHLHELTARAIGGLRLPPLRRIGAFTSDPVGTQERLLRDLLERASDTEWGRRLGFREIAAARDVVSAYQERVPLHDYEALRGDVERIRRGEEDIIWPGGFKHFAVSSGTASAGKIIPVSREMLKKNRSFSVAVGFSYLNRTGNTAYLMGKHLSLPGRIEEDAAYPGTLVGEVSGLQAEFAPAFFKYVLQAVPNEVAFLPNWEQKLRTIAERTVDMNVRSVIMAPTWALAFFRELMQVHNDRNTRSVSTVGELWPNLQLFISGGVALSSYRDLLQETIGLPDLHFLETYGASEGFFSFQSEMNDPSMLLHLDNGVFFEFVRKDELDDPNARRFTIADVEPNVRYGLFVSTCSGLWGYAVGDVVRFSSVDPHKILVAGRTSEMLDKYGEAVFGEEARGALAFACERTGARVRDFHLAPRPLERSRPPSHQWLIEFEDEPPGLDDFAGAIDEYLSEVNRHYQIRREARSFDRPDILSLPRGTFYAWLKSTKGRISGQTKMPRMSEEREIADGVLAFVETKPGSVSS